MLKTSLAISLRVVSLSIVMGGLVWQGHAVKADESPVRLNAVQQRLLRILTAPSEKARLKSIALLQKDPDFLNMNFHVLLAATQTLLESSEEQAKSDDETELAFPPDSLIAYFELLAAHPTPDSKQLLRKALDHPNDFVAMVAGDVVGRREWIEMVEPLCSLVKRDAFSTHYGFRFTVVRALVCIRHPDAYKLLQQLGKELTGELAKEIENKLADVTLRDFGGEEELFNQWRSEIKSKVKLAEFNVAEDAEAPKTQNSLYVADYHSASTPRKYARPSYYGIDLDANRILFILDTSGSMQEPTRYGVKLAQAKKELNDAIESLPPSTEFSILFFSDRVRAWNDELVFATPENRKSAIKSVNSLTSAGKTNTCGVMKSSLEFDDQLEAVFFLTDGAPTTGSTTNPQRILEEFAYANRWRHLRMHTIGVGVSDATQQFLKRLAEISGAEFIQVD